MKPFLGRWRSVGRQSAEHWKYLLVMAEDENEAQSKLWSHVYGTQDEHFYSVDCEIMETIE